jgi:hypothetical protein
MGEGSTMGREPQIRQTNPSRDPAAILAADLADLPETMRWEARRQRSHDQIDDWSGEHVTPNWEARPDPVGPKGKQWSRSGGS